MGDLYVNMHKHDWSYTLGHIDGLWSYAYKCLGYCNKTLDIMPESSKSQSRSPFYPCNCILYVTGCIS